MSLHKALEYGYFPDWLVRLGLRRWLAQYPGWGAETDARLTSTPLDARIACFLPPPFSTLFAESPVQGLDELPVACFQKILGPHWLYSAGWWAKEVRDLETAEAAMLALSCERAQLGFDQDILEIGDGWGAVALWVAKFYPDSRVVAVADSAPQHAFISACGNAQGLNNLRVVTNLDALPPNQRFDRVLAVENFARRADNQYRSDALATYLKPGGKLFMQAIAFPQLEAGFASSQSLDDRQPEDIKAPVRLEEQWYFSGEHYRRTLQAWLARQQRQRRIILQSLGELYDPAAAVRHFQRRRLLFLIYAELFGNRQGKIFGIRQFRFSKPDSNPAHCA